MNEKPVLKSATEIKESLSGCLFLSLKPSIKVQSVLSDLTQNSDISLCDFLNFNCATLFLGAMIKQPSARFSRLRSHICFCNMFPHKGINVTSCTEMKIQVQEGFCSDIIWDNYRKDARLPEQLQVNHFVNVFPAQSYCQPLVENMNVIAFRN